METILEEQSRKIIGQYRKRKWLGIGILVIGIVYAFYLLLGVLIFDYAQLLYHSVLFIFLSGKRGADRGA